MTWGQRSQRRTELPPNWPTLRQQRLTIDNHTCVICGQPATDVDHIGDKHNHTLSNLRSLCATHHKQRTSAQGHAARQHATRPPEPHPGYT